MIESLFNSIRRKNEIEINDTNCNEEIDVEVSLETIMEEYMTRVARFLSTIASSSIFSLEELQAKS